MGLVYFAKLDDDNNVTQVSPVAADAIKDSNGSVSETLGIQFLTNWDKENHSKWKMTSETGEFRNRFASTSGYYHSAGDSFVDAQPYSSWTLSTVNYDWEAPSAKPTGNYWWDEDNTTWVEWTDEELARIEASLYNND